MFVIAHNKIFYRRCALFLPSFPVHTIKFILSGKVVTMEIMRHESSLTEASNLTCTCSFLKLAMIG
jgi:hypothetical protein